MKKELKVCEAELYIPVLKQIDDSFVQEVLSFWTTQNRKGFIYFIPAEDDTYKVASFILLEKNKDWTIRGTWTDPSYRHQNLSSTILQNIIRDFESNNIYNYLWVNITPGAEELYIKNGFRIYGKRTDCDPNMSVGIYSRFNEKEEKRKFIEKYIDHVLL